MQSYHRRICALGRAGAEPELRQLPAPRVGSAAAASRVLETPAPAREAAPRSRQRLPAARRRRRHPPPTRLNLDGVGVLSARPPQRPRAPPPSGPDPLPAAPRSRARKSWRWRQSPGPASALLAFRFPAPPVAARRLLLGPAVPGPDADPGDPLTSNCEDGLLLLPSLYRAPPALSGAGGEQQWSRSRSPEEA